MVGVTARATGMCPLCARIVGPEVLRESPDHIAASTPAPAVIAIDVPIGLLDVGSRRCDRDVRRLLGRRSASVFTAPIRPLLTAASYAEASAIRRTVEGKGLSVQAWAIVPKIREADDALRADPALRGLVREAHPELCFAFVDDGRPLTHAKKTADGKAQRVAVLRDAYAAVWTAARVARGEAVTVPAEPPRDRFGLPMEMVY